MLSSLINNIAFLIALAATLGFYFTFAAVQGDYGVLRQAQTADEMQGLTAERDKLAAELDGLKNLTSAFKSLYDSMPAEQKKNADVVFEKYTPSRPANQGSQPISQWLGRGPGPGQAGLGRCRRRPACAPGSRRAGQGYSGSD